MTNNKFNVVSQKMEETETGEKIIYVIYNHLKKRCQTFRNERFFKEYLRKYSKRQE